MLKLVLPGHFQVGKRQSTAKCTVLLLCLFALFYYLSWAIIRPSAHISTTTSISKEQLVPFVLPAAIPTPCPASSSPSSPPPPQSPYDATKVAFIAETRPLSHLPALFAHMTAVIPPEWTFKFMGSPTATTFLRSSPLIHSLEKTGKLSFLDLPSNYSLENRERISQMFTDVHLYRDLLYPAEHLLVFQPDSILCANAPKTLNSFLEWDWVGAPWSKTATYGGNGGLSLRKVSKIVKVLEKENRRRGDGALEDLWLSSRLNALPGAKMANASVSKTFSVESVWDASPLGYHVGWLGVHHEQIWDDKRQVAHVLEYCPEVKIILGMQLAGDKPESVKKVEAEKQQEVERKKEEERKKKEKEKEESERVKKKVDKMVGKKDQR